MLRTAFSAIGMLVAGLVGVGTPTWALQDRATDRIPETAIVARVLQREFPATQRRFATYRGRPVVGLSGPSGLAMIDRGTGILIDYFRLNDTTPHPGLGDVPRVSQEEALQRARQFVERAGVELRAPWVLTEEKYLPSGAYSFLWRKCFHGIVLPAWISVVVHGNSGEVLVYTLVDDPVVVPLITPRIGAAEAIQRVAEHQGYRRWVVRKVELWVCYQPHYPGPQVLAWWIELVNPDARTHSESEVWAYVNAVTGVVFGAAMPASAVPIDADTRSRLAQLAEKGTANEDALPKFDFEAIAKEPIPPTIFELAQRKGARRQR